MISIVVIYFTYKLFKGHVPINQQYFFLMEEQLHYNLHTSVPFCTSNNEIGLNNQCFLTET